MRRMRIGARGGGGGSPHADPAHTCASLRLLCTWILIVICFDVRVLFSIR